MELDKIKISPIFMGLETSELEELLAHTHHTIQSFAKGEILAMQGDACNRLITLIEGSVKGEMTDASGKVVKVEDIAAPNPLAILFLFGNENRFPVQVTANSDAKALVIPKQAVLKMLQQNEQVLTNYLNLSAQYASFLSKKLHFMSFRSIRQKLAMYFLELLKPEMKYTELNRTQTALAEYFGVSRPSLARELAKMQEEGLVIINKKQVQIPDRNKLMHLVSF